MKVDCKRGCLIREEAVSNWSDGGERQEVVPAKETFNRKVEWLKGNCSGGKRGKGRKVFSGKGSTCNKRPSGEDLKRCVPGTQGASERMTLRQTVSRAMPFSPPCANSHYLWRTVQRLSFIITCSLSSVPQHVSVLWISKAIFLCITHSKTLLDTVSYFHFLDCLHYIWFSTQLVPREFWSRLTFISLPLASGTHRHL